MAVISLDKNENRYPHSPKVLEYLKHISPEILSFYGSSVDPLVYRLSDVFHVPAEQIFLTHGGEALLKESIGSILEPGDTALLPLGGWAYYTQLVEEREGKSEFFVLDKGMSEYSYPTLSIKNQLQDLRPKLLILASPNNPTGNVIYKQDLLAILEVAKQTETFVILDEAYFGFSQSDYNWEDIKLYPKLLIVRTFSKLFGLVGLRIGFGFYTDGWDSLKKELYRYLGFSRLSSEIALCALNSLEYYQNNAQMIIQEREKLEDFFRDMGATVYKSHANFMFFELSSEVFLKSQEVFKTAPIKIKFFSAEKEPWFKNCVRITVGLPEDNQLVCQIFKQIV